MKLVDLKPGLVYQMINNQRSIRLYNKPWNEYLKPSYDLNFASDQFLKSGSYFLIAERARFVGSSNKYNNNYAGHVEFAMLTKQGILWYGYWVNKSEDINNLELDIIQL